MFQKCHCNNTSSHTFRNHLLTDETLQAKTATTCKAQQTTPKPTHTSTRSCRPAVVCSPPVDEHWSTSSACFVSQPAIPTALAFSENKQRLIPLNIINQFTFIMEKRSFLWGRKWTFKYYLVELRTSNGEVLPNHIAKKFSIRGPHTALRCVLCSPHTFVTIRQLSMSIRWQILPCYPETPFINVVLPASTAVSNYRTQIYEECQVKN